MAFHLAMDTGGTFSDLVLADDDQVLGLYKAPTTPDDLFEGVLAAIAVAAEDQGTDAAGLLSVADTFVYSTTRATNAVLEGRSARTALLVTEGHRDILLYREGGKSRPLDISVPYPEPYVPRHLTFAVPERITASGEIHRPLDEGSVLATIERLAELEVEAVGVCLLWSVVDPSHEQRVGELLREHLPGVEVTLSHELNPVIREYRRASATVIDASLKPLMRDHLADIEARLRQLGFRGEPLMVTHVTGGVLRMGEIREKPLLTVDSGPVLAPVASLAYVGGDPDLAGKDVVSVDAGGTSFDISPTRDGGVVYSREKWLGPRWAGHITGLPAVEIRSIGAGGGSIASVDAMGLLTVGPASAGAVPGPACYGRGGELPTVTDAALVLGLLDPVSFFGGRMPLDEARAREALRAQVARPLGVDPEEAAASVLAVFTEDIRAFLFETLVDQGLDPRSCTLVAGGGAAGLNIVDVAREAGVTHVVVPGLAAGRGARGGHDSDNDATWTRSWSTSTAAFDVGTAREVLAGLRREAERFVERCGVDGDASFDTFCEARYAHQLWELTVPLGSTWSIDEPDAVVQLHAAFDRLHEKLYAVRHPDDPVEVTTWRVDARIRRPKPALPDRAGAGAPSGARVRKATFAGEVAEAQVLDGAALELGATVTGPAIIEEPATTIVVPPGASAQVRPSHYLIDVGEHQHGRA